MSYVVKKGQMFPDDKTFDRCRLLLSLDRETYLPRCFSDEEILSINAKMNREGGGRLAHE